MPVLDGAFVQAVRDQVPGGWVVHVSAGCSLQAAVDGALLAEEAPDTPRYDALTAAARRPTGQAKQDALLDRRRRAARRERWKFLVEPVSLLWVVVAGLGATVMSAANVRQFGRGDVAWDSGSVLLLGGVVAVLGHLTVAAWRLVWWSVRAAPSEWELAQALLRDLRYDWRRFLPNGWFRARDVPRSLPVLLIAAPPPGMPRPALLGAYQRWPWPRLPYWLWRLLAMARRPAAVLVTDCQVPDHVPARVWIRLAWTSVLGFVRWLPRQPARLVRRWRAEPGTAWRRSTVLLALLAGRCVPIGRALRRTARRLVGVAVPRTARRRARRLTQYGVVFVLLLGSFYADRSPDQPYCLWRVPDAVRVAAGMKGGNVSTDTTDGEWIGYRTCLGWWQLGADVLNTMLARVSGPLTVHHPGPDDNPHLFDVNLIYRENKRVERLAGGQRPLITVALITSLTSADPTRPIRSVVAEREGLAGAYVAQLRINRTRAAWGPYVRLAVVNVGDLTPVSDTRVNRHLAIVRDKLRQLAEDPTLAAAVVTVNSITPVQTMLRDSLGAAGVPMVTPTMSADGFGRAFGVDPIFFQVVATNDDEVELTYRYAASRRVPLVYFYPVRNTTGTPGDLYLSSLYCDVLRRHQPGLGTVQGPPCRPAAVLGNAVTHRPAVPVSLVPWSPWPQVNDVATRACPPPSSAAGTAKGSTPERPLVFFGGRYTDVAEFLHTLQLSCAGRMPEVTLTPNAARFLSDRDLAQQIPHGLRVLISYPGPVLTCETLRNSSLDSGRRLEFYDDIRTALHRCAGRGDTEADRWLAASWAATEYDSLLMIDDAVLRTGLRHASDARGDILACLRATVKSCTDIQYPGAYGTISLRNGLGRRPAVLLRVKDLADAFESGGSTETVGTCDTRSTPCTAHFDDLS